MLLTQEVEVKVNSSTIKHYESLGYQIPMRKASKSIFQHTGREFAYDLNNTFMVRVSDLPTRSNVKIDAMCDCCGETVNGISYEHYCKMTEKFGNYVCYKCKTSHYRESCVKTYGVDNPVKLEEFRDKMIETSLQRYGTEHPMQNILVLQKAKETLYKNETTPTSLQQLYLHSLYNGKLNYPIKNYNVDICFPEEKICMEYDGGGHSLEVKFGRLTQEEFEYKELIRNNVIKRAGYKQMRIISLKDKLPSDEILLQMLSEAKQYFFDYPEHSWIEYNIDTSTVRNAEHKDGVFFDYGKLRKIK